MMTEVAYGATKIKIARENEEKLKHYPISEKQLEIGFEGLAKYACPIYAGGNSYLNDNGKLAREYIDKIEELNEIHKQE